MIRIVQNNKRLFIAALAAILVIVPGAAIFKAASPTPIALAQTAASSSTQTTAQKQAALEAQLSQLQNQIDQYQNQITADQQKGSSLTSEINALNAQIAKLNLQIQAINVTLEQINSQIDQTTAQIGVTQGEIVSEKSTIGTLLNALYKNDQTGFLESFLANPKLSTLWDDSENISLFESSLNAAVAQLSTLTGQLQNQNQQLAQSQTAAQTA